jgi:enterochelin esterase-like enzyme
VARLVVGLLVLALAGIGAVAAMANFVAAPAGHGKRSSGAGTIGSGSFHSRALRGTDHYSVYLPPGYSSSRRHYPVIYFLHGLPGEPSAYRSIGAIASAVQQSGMQAIVVGAQGARPGDRDPEWLDHGSGRNWETATAVELVHTIDSRYRTIRVRSGRLLIGISAGGYGATLIGAHHPDTYSVVESWSGYFHATNPAGTAPLDLGSEQANDYADFRKLIPTLHTRYGRWWTRTWFGFYVGTNDRRFRSENEKLYTQLRAAHVPHVTFRLYNGGHDWSLWRAHAVEWVERGLGFASKPR